MSKTVGIYFRAEDYDEFKNDMAERDKAIRELFDELAGLIVDTAVAADKYGKANSQLTEWIREEYKQKLEKILEGK